MAEMASGVKQQPLPPGETESQAPPVVVDAVALKRTVELLVKAIVRTWGRGSAPANALVNARAGTFWNVCAWSRLGSPKIKTKVIVARRTCC